MARQMRPKFPHSHYASPRISAYRILRRRANHRFFLRRQQAPPANAPLAMNPAAPQVPQAAVPGRIPRLSVCLSNLISLLVFPFR